MLPGETTLRHAAFDVTLSARRRARKYLSGGRKTFAGLWSVEDGVLIAADSPRPHGLSVEETAARLDVDGYRRRMQTLLDSPLDSYRAFLEHDVKAWVESWRIPCKGVRWAAKEVGIAPEAVVCAFGEAFPAGQFVMIKRDPRFVVRSIIRDSRRKGATMSSRRILGECIEARRVNRFIARMDGGDRVFIVEYEDLVRNVESVMKRIFDFLEMPFEEAALYPTVMGVPSVVATSSRQTRSVFYDEAPWTKDLRPREIAVIATFFGVDSAATTAGLIKRI